MYKILKVKSTGKTKQKIRFNLYNHSFYKSDWFVNTVTVKAAYLLECNAWFCLKKYIWIVGKDFDQKYDACNLDCNKEKVKIRNIKEQRFQVCHYLWQRDSFNKKIVYMFFKVWKSKIHKWNRSPKLWIIDSSSLISRSRAGVPLEGVSLQGAQHGCHQRLKVLVHRTIFLSAYLTL